MYCTDSIETWQAHFISRIIFYFIRIVIRIFNHSEDRINICYRFTITLLAGIARMKITFKLPGDLKQNTEKPGGLNVNGNGSLFLGRM